MRLTSVVLLAILVVIALVAGGRELAGTGDAAPARASASAGPAPAPTWDPRGSHTLTFDDEFAGRGVDTARWEEGWFVRPGDGGFSGPVNPGSDQACDSAANVSQPGDGYLHLELTHTPSTCSGSRYPYSAALVNTRLSFSQEGGSFEARVYIPPVRSSSGAVEAAGYPAVWLNGPSDVPWPQHGEIDLVEGMGGATAAHLHYDDSAGTAQAPGWTSPAAYTGWHDVGASWDPSHQTVTIYWDGTAVFTHAFPATDPEYLILGYSMGSRPPAAFPSAMLVDWVRAWAPGR